MKKFVTSVELRKLIVKLRNEDKLSIGDISKTVGKSKSVIHNILRKLDETESCEAKKPLGRPRKTTVKEGRWIGKNQKRIDLWQQLLMLTLALKNTISQRLNEINLNSRVASTKPYISRKNKMSWLKFASEHVIWTVELCSFQRWVKV